MTKEEFEKEIEDWWRIKFRVELKDDICQKLTTDEAEELCNKIAEPREKRIVDLEKENADLKKQLEMSNKVYNDNLDYSHHIEGQLTNAKEIIREFIKYEINEYDGSLEIHFEELKKQAEQFLKDCEVEK